MKKLIKKIKTEFIWYFDRRVLHAINDGTAYEEVERLVEEIYEAEYHGRR